MNVVIILRAVSGSGKSTFADWIKEFHPEALICCADTFFERPDGTYDFDPSLVHEAHRQCKERFANGVSQKVPAIIVANTNTTVKQFEYYETLAKAAGYKVFHLILENRHGNRDVHDVPAGTLWQQRNNILQSICL